MVRFSSGANGDQLGFQPNENNDQKKQLASSLQKDSK
jgi:hypothetical protein